jgi:hypothetical protein
VVSLSIRVVCRAINYFLGDRTDGRLDADEVELTLSRSGDPYFTAFRARCLTWVYGDDPRRTLEQEPVSA